MRQINVIDAVGRTIRGVKYHPSLGIVISFIDDTFVLLLSEINEYDDLSEIWDNVSLSECDIYYQELEEIGIIKSEVK